MSDISLADGMPLVWVARLLGIPLPERVSGSDLFERLRQQTDALWRVFFFGGQQGAGQQACLAIGNNTAGMLPTGYIYPGFVSNAEMSRDDLIQSINQSQSDLVAVSLGAAKGQDWICRNRQRINAPVMAHLGAVINFVAGNIRRAPRWMQRCGLEWLWRAREESSLVRRYLKDGLAFLRILSTQVLPLALHQALKGPRADSMCDASYTHIAHNGMHELALRGSWTAANAAPLRAVFSRIEGESGPVRIDLHELKGLDSAVTALLLLLDQSQRDRGFPMQLLGTPPTVRRYLHWSGVQHLVMQ